MAALTAMTAACGPSLGEAADVARGYAWREYSEIGELLKDRPQLAGQERLVEVRAVLAEPHNLYVGEMREPFVGDDGSLHFLMFYAGTASEGGGFNERAARALLCMEFVLDAEGPTEVDLKDAACEGPAREVDDRYREVNL